MNKQKEITKKQMEADKAIEREIVRVQKAHKKTLKKHYTIMQMIEAVKKAQTCR